jgi:hypothetical protein
MRKLMKMLLTEIGEDFKSPEEEDMLQKNVRRVKVVEDRA